MNERVFYIPFKRLLVYIQTANLRRDLSRYKQVWDMPAHRGTCTMPQISMGTSVYQTHIILTQGQPEIIVLSLKL